MSMSVSATSVRSSITITGRRLAWLDDDDKVVEEIESNKCPICMEDYSNTFHKPKVLQCGHSGCASCLETAWTSRNRRLHVNGFLCQVCKQFHLGNPADLKVAFGMITQNTELERLENEQVLLEEERNRLTEATKRFTDVLQKAEKDMATREKNRRRKVKAWIAQAIGKLEQLVMDLKRKQNELDNTSKHYENALRSLTLLKLSNNHKFVEAAEEALHDDNVDMMSKTREDMDKLGNEYVKNKDTFSKSVKLADEFFRKDTEKLSKEFGSLERFQYNSRSRHGPLPPLR